MPVHPRGILAIALITAACAASPPLPVSKAVSFTKVACGTLEATVVDASPDLVAVELTLHAEPGQTSRSRGQDSLRCSVDLDSARLLLRSTLSGRKTKGRVVASEPIQPMVAESGESSTQRIEFELEPAGDSETGDADPDEDELAEIIVERAGTAPPLHVPLDGDEQAP